jgi:K+/H+ antiporter YhaU regulatory subunit KhtT
MADVQVQAKRLPGIGWRYTVAAGQGRCLVVIAEDGGPRHLVIVDPRLDEALTTVRLPGEHAAVLAALLTGARFVLTSPEETVEVGAPDPAEVVVETVPVATGSPAVGLAPDEITPRLVPDAVLLGVIDDRTPELLECDGERGIRVGDRLVVAVRRSHLENLQALV